MRRMIKSALIIASGEAFFQVVLLLKTKYLAVSIGPEGMGVFELLAAFFFLFVGLLQNWITPTAIRFVANFRSEEDIGGIDFVSSLSITGCLLLSFAAAVIVLLFNDFFRQHFLSEEVLLVFIVLYAVWFIFTGGFNVSVGFLLGHQRFKLMMTAKIFLAVVDLICVIVFIYLFGTTGFFLGLAIAAFIGFLFIVFIGKPRLRLPSLQMFRQNIPLVGRLIRFSGANFIVGILYFTTYYILRRYIRFRFGLASLGIFYGCYTLMMSVELLAKAINSYSFSELCKTLEPDQRNKQIDDYIYLILLVLTPLCSAMILFGDFLVPTLFARNFGEMAGYLPIMILFIYLHNILYIFDVNLMGLEKNLEHLIVVSTQHILSCILGLWWMKVYGLVGAAWGLLVGSQISLTAALGFSYFFGYKLRMSVLMRFIVCVVIMAATILLCNVPLYFRISVYIGMVACFIFIIEKQHRLFLWSTLKRWLSNTSG